MTEPRAIIEPHPQPQAIPGTARRQTIYVVIVNYRRADLTARAVASVLEEDEKEVRVIVVDNASDGSWFAEPIAHQPRVISIENEANLGFGAACNQGFERALEDETCVGVLLLNNDAELERGALGLLHAAAAEYGMAAPKILLPDGRIFSAGGVVELWRARARNRGIYEPDRGQYDHAETLEFASGCVLLISMAALKSGVRFYEPYFLYYEDTDLCLNLVRMGYEVQYVPHARARHLESASTAGPDRRAVLLYYDSRNRLLFLRRNSRGVQRAWGYLYMFGTGAIRAIRFRMHGHKAEAAAIFAGLRDFVRNRTGAR